MSDHLSNVSILFNQGRINGRKIMLLPLVLLLVCTWIIGSIPFSSMANAAVHTNRLLFQSSFTVDGVTISLRSSFLPGKFTVPASDSATQMASAVATRPYRDIEVEAIPFHVNPSLESLPAAASGNVGLYRSLLQRIRISQGGKIIAHIPAITVFGKQVPGQATLLKLHLYGSQPQATIVTEYVTEAGSRLWLIRMIREVASASVAASALPITLAHNAASVTFLQSLSSISLSSTTLNKPSTLAASLTEEANQAKALAASHKTVKMNSSLSSPGWWNGNCDYWNYYNATGWSSWQMSTGQLDGVVACGPRPWRGGPNHQVNFFPGSFPVLEFQCVELSMRWMDLAWGISPYSANGNTVVSNFNTYNSGTTIKVVYNSPGCCLYPEPGDVLSYCAGCTNGGHTSVVMSSNVDGNGNGSIEVMEENGAYSGVDTLTVANYEVQNTGAGWVYGWLHNFGSSRGCRNCV